MLHPILSQFRDGVTGDWVPAWNTKSGDEIRRLKESGCRCHDFCGFVEGVEQRRL
jgi:hypothetical protein